MVIYDLLTTLIMKIERRQRNYGNMSTCHTLISNIGLTFTSNIQYAFYVLVKVKLFQLYVVFLGFHRNHSSFLWRGPFI